MSFNSDAKKLKNYFMCFKASCDGDVFADHVYQQALAFKLNKRIEINQAKILPD